MGIDDDLTNLTVGILLFLAVAPFVLTQIIITFLVIYKMWAAIQDGNARTTPGKAIGFLFIPFFNLYWVFQVWGGFPTDYNEYAERYQLPVSPLRSGIYRAYPVLIAGSAIPLIGILSMVVGWFVLPVITAKTCDAVNELADAVRERRTELRQMPMRQPEFTNT